MEGAGEASATMAADIDSNPVRAGIAQNPKDYRWSGSGEAMAGRKRAKEGSKAKGRLPVAEYWRCRARYFRDGTVFGPKVTSP